MVNELQVFSFENKEVRTVIVDEEPHWVLKDVCDVLEIKNATDVSKRLDEDEVTRFNLGGLVGEVNIINESGLYSVILRSDKPNAKQFKKWITGEVIPSIRKTGGYRVPTNPMEALKLMFEATDNIEKRVTNIEENQTLSPSEYSLLQTRVSERVKHIKKSYRVENTKENNSIVYKAINSDVKVITGVQTRSQIRNKDFDKVLKFINEWEPSKATQYLLSYKLSNHEITQNH